MNDLDVIRSPLSQSVAVNGHRFEIQIYRGKNTEWTLGVLNAKGELVVCDETFQNDEVALEAALADFRNEPIETFL